MKKTTLACHILLGAITLSGCAATRHPVVQCKFPRQTLPAGDALVAQEYGAISPIPLDAVQFLDQTLSRRLAVQSLLATRTETDTVRVTARLINCTDTPLTVGARLDFIDGQHAAAEPQSVWQTLVLQPRSMALYQESSFSRAVQHYVMELRSGGQQQQ
jgi:hypothetical protein